MWATRHAESISAWLNSWLPPGVHGARSECSSADAFWKVTIEVDAHRADGTNLALLSLDQKQCFDRLHISMLHELASRAGLPPAAFHALRLYARLDRFLFIDGQPIGHVISGDNLCGIPQGCPLAALFCNLTSAAWEIHLNHVVPQFTCLSYLDDRLCFASDAKLFEQVLAATAEIDAAFGPELNKSKCAWAATKQKPRHAGARLRELSYCT